MNVISDLQPSPMLRKYIDRNIKLSNSEIRELIEKYQQDKDPDAFNLLISSVSKILSKLIINNASKFKNADPLLSFDDVFAEMVLVLGRELLRYDPSRTNLSTFVYNQIQPIFRNPEHYFNRHHVKSSISLDKELIKKSSNSSDINYLKDIIPDENLVDPIDELESDEEKRVIRKAISRLPEMERLIISLIYGITKDNRYENKYGKVDLSSIARGLNTSVTTVKYHIVQAKEKLKKIISDMGYWE